MASWFGLNDKRFTANQLVVPLIDLCTQRGANREALLRGTGLFYSELTSPTAKVSAHQLLKLIAQADKHINSRDISFLLGRRLLLNQPQAVSQMLFNARHLADVLRMLDCYQQQIFPFVYFHKEQAKQQQYTLLNCALGAALQPRFFIELSCTAINAGCKQLFGQQIPLHFYFDFPRPRNIYQYEENLGHRLHFDQPLTMLSLPQQWLTKPLPLQHKTLRQQHRASCQQQHASRYLPVALVQAASLYLSRHKTANLEDVACHLGLSPASFKRKLREHQLSFQQLQDQVRRQQAVFDLKIRNNSNQQVAERLHINNLNNFRRAFKRWTGMTPSELKAK